MNFLPDFNDIIVYQDVTFYQILGLLTVLFATLDVLIYTYLIWSIGKTRHNITQSLKHKFFFDTLLLCTTILMGMGALFQLPSEWWQAAYLCRVGVLILTPVVSIRLAFAVRDIIKERV